MANERVELTIALNDQISDTLHRVGSQFESLSRRVKETGEQGGTHFRRVGDEINNIHRGLGNVNVGLGSMGTMMKSMLMEFNNQLGGAMGRMRGFEGAMGTVLATASRTALTLGSGVGGVGGGLLIITAAAVAAAGSIYAIGRALTNSYQDTKNLRLELGEKNDAAINHARRVGEVLGMAPGQTDQILKQMTALILDSTRGTSSDLAKMMENLAGTGRALADHMRTYMLQGHSAMEGFDEFYREVAKGSEDFQRRVAAAIGQPYWYVHMKAEETRNTPRGYAPSAEDQAKLDEYRGRVQRASNALKFAIQDQIREGWDQLQLKALPYLEKALDLMNQFLHSAAWEELKSAIGDTIKNDLADIKKIYDIFLPVYNFFKKYAGSITEPGWFPGGEGGGWKPPDKKNSWKNWFQKQSGEGGMPAPTLISMGGTGSSNIMGGEPIVLRDISSEGKESNIYLRDIRDIMAWMRDQQGGGTGEGGTGPGGARVWNASLGGANAPGMGTGAGPNTNPPGTGPGGTGGPEGPGGPPGTGPGGVPASTTLGPYGQPMPPWGTTVTGPEAFGGGIGKGVAGDVPGLPGGPSGRSLTRDERRAATGGNVPSGGGGDTGLPNLSLASQRARFEKELTNNPALMEKALNISLGEQQHSAGNLGVWESAMNRAAMMGTPFAQEMRRTSEGGYYAAKPGNYSSEMIAMARTNMLQALRGSNITDYATDNASGDWGRSRMASGMYTRTKPFEAGGEYFTYPSRSDARGHDRYKRWREGAARGQGPGGQPILGGIDSMEGDVKPEGRGIRAGGRFNVPKGSPLTGTEQQVTLSNGISFKVNAEVAEQFKGFYEDLIKSGAPVHDIGGYGTRSGNASQHPRGYATDWAQGKPGPWGGMISLGQDVHDWMTKNPDKMNEIERKWGMSGGEHWNNLDKGHFSIDTRFGSKHLAALRNTALNTAGPAAPTSATPSGISIAGLPGGPSGRALSRDERLAGGYRGGSSSDEFSDDGGRAQRRQQQAGVEQNRANMDAALGAQNSKTKIGKARVQISIGENRQEKSMPNDEGLIPTNINLTPQMANGGRPSAGIGEAKVNNYDE